MSCPICGRETVAAARPFCSKRCADVDLGRWLTGAYAIPAEELEEDEETRPDADGEAAERH
jgi:endogenous inhibitor of DNA gyrase (YacG/DUF329 family)